MYTLEDAADDIGFHTFAEVESIAVAWMFEKAKLEDQYDGIDAVPQPLQDFLRAVMATSKEYRGRE